MVNNGVSGRMDRLFNRRQDGRAVCIAADHGYMSNVSSNVINLPAIAQAVVGGGADGILLSPGQANHLSSLFEGPRAPALIVRADWMNMPRLDSADQQSCASAAPFPPKDAERQASVSSWGYCHHHLSFPGN